MCARVWLSRFARGKALLGFDVLLRREDQLLARLLVLESRSVEGLDGRVQRFLPLLGLNVLRRRKDHLLLWWRHVLQSRHSFREFRCRHWSHWLLTLCFRHDDDWRRETRDEREMSGRRVLQERESERVEWRQSKSERRL